MKISRLMFQISVLISAVGIMGSSYGYADIPTAKAPEKSGTLVRKSTKLQPCEKSLEWKLPPVGYQNEHTLPCTPQPGKGIWINLKRMPPDPIKGPAGPALLITSPGSENETFEVGTFKSIKNTDMRFGSVQGVVLNLDCVRSLKDTPNTQSILLKPSRPGQKFVINTLRMGEIGRKDDCKGY